MKLYTTEIVLIIVAIVALFIGTYVSFVALSAQSPMGMVIGIAQLLGGLIAAATVIVLDAIRLDVLPLLQRAQ